MNKKRPVTRFSEQRTRSMNYTKEELQQLQQEEEERAIHVQEVYNLYKS